MKSFGGVLPNLQATGVPAGFVSFVASNIQDAGGNKLAMGTVEVLPTDGLDTPISAAAGGAGQPGQMSEYTPAVFEVTNGALPSGSIIADTNQTLPPNICYRITIKDPTGYPLSVLRRVQTTLNTTFNLDTFQPNVPTQTRVQLVAGTVTSLPNGTAPTVNISQTGGVPQINFGIPAGASGLVGLSVVSATGSANYQAALSDDVIVTSLVAPYYVQVAASGDTLSRVRTVINVGTSYAGVVAPGLSPQFLPPGKSLTFTFNGSVWTADNNYNTYAQVNTATYLAPLSLSLILYSYTAAGSITLSASATAQQPPLDIYNYGSFPVSVYQGNGTTLLCTIPAGVVVTFRCFTPGNWIVKSSSAYTVPVFGPSGASHASGLVPDPGAASGITRFLREDATWQVPPPNTSGGVALPSPITDYTSFGDSITVAVGATQTGRGYAQRLSAYFGGVFKNFGFGGDEAPDMSWKVNADYDPKGLTPLPFVTMFIGHNDINYVGNTANGLAKYGSALMAALAHVAIPQDCKVFGQGATLAGSFAANPSLPGFIGTTAVTGTTNGDTVTFSVNTTAANQPLYICWYGQDSNGGTASFSLNGTVIDNVTTQGPGGPIATVNGGTTAAWCNRYVIPTAGTHTVVIKITSATAAGNSFTFLWAGVPSGTSATPARILAMDPVYEAGLSAQATTNAYIGVLGPIAAQLAADGLPVLHFQTNSYVNNALGMSTTATSAPDGTYIPASTTPGLHPNDYGHAQIAAGVASVAAPSGLPSQRAFARGFRQISGGGTAAVNSGDEIIIISGMTSVSLPAVTAQREEHLLFNYGTTVVSITAPIGGPWALYPGASLHFINIGNGFFQVHGVGLLPPTSVSLNGSTLAPGAADSITVAVAGAQVGSPVSLAYSDGSDPTSGGYVQLSGRIASEGIVTVERRLSAFASAAFTTVTKLVNVTVLP